MGSNMSWVFVDNIDQHELFEALDLAPIEGTPDQSELGTSQVPLAGATLKSGWCAVFARYALVMDALLGTTPPRIERLPARSRCIGCVVLEHAMISYAGLWQAAHPVWEIWHHGGDHLDTSGELPEEFAGIRDSAMAKQRQRPGQRGVDDLFNIPIDTAQILTNYRYEQIVEPDFFRTLRNLVPVNGSVLTKLSRPPKWWQLTNSIEYE